MAPCKPPRLPRSWTPTACGPRSVRSPIRRSRRSRSSTWASSGRSTSSDETVVGRAPADVRRLPGPRGHPRSGRGSARRRPAAGRGRVQLRGALDHRADHGPRPPRADRRRIRAADAGRCVPRELPDRAPGRRRRVPHLRLAPDAAGQRVRPDAVPVDPLLPGLPPTLRRLQGGVTMADEKTGTPPTPPTPPAAPAQPGAPRRASGGSRPAACGRTPGLRRRVRRRTRHPPIRAGRQASSGR